MFISIYELLAFKDYNVGFKDFLFDCELLCKICCKIDNFKEFIK